MTEIENFFIRLRPILYLLWIIFACPLPIFIGFCFFSLNLKIFFINVKNNLSWFIFDLLIVNFYHAKVLFLFLLLFLVKFINIFFYHIGFLVTENFSLYLGYRKIQPYYIIFLYIFVLVLHLKVWLIWDLFLYTLKWMTLILSFFSQFYLIVWITTVC